MDIDSEISKLKVNIKNSTVTHPDYMPKELEELQNLTINTHANLAVAMNSIIHQSIKTTLNLKKEDFMKAVVSLSPIMEKLSYRQKVEVIESIGGVSKELVKALKKVNSCRIEFAHPEGMFLRSKYDSRDFKGKQNIRDLLRSLTNAQNLMNVHFQNLISPKEKEEQ